mmetsp:Transcript_11638/g.17661  ORF Transcript_11638/g.17661 Transcript_11638/m.17661 type:complete len:86 (-) Transcript_11638:2275-2532(-)
MSSEDGGEDQEVGITQGAGPILVFLVDHWTFTGADNEVVCDVVHLCECGDDAETHNEIDYQVPNQQLNINKEDPNLIKRPPQHRE